MQVLEKKHSPIGASSAERFWNCPGSVALIKELNQVQEESRYAAEGTAAHELCDYYVKKGLVVDNDWLEEEIEVGEFTFTVNDEMMAAVDVFISTIRDDREKHNAPYAPVFSEQEFLLSHIDDEAFGTCDANLFIPFNRINIYDFKYGKGVAVEVTDNKQLPYYGLGAYYQLSEDDRADIREIEIVIVQPRAPHPDGPVRRKIFTVAELLQFEENLTGAIKKVRAGDTTLSAGGHCKFCPIKPTCPAMREKINADAVVQFDAFLPNQELPKPTEMTLEQVSMVLQNAEMLSSWIGAVKAYAHNLAETGKEVPGFKLVEGKSNRKWKDEEVVIAQYKEEFGESLFNEPKLKSPAQLEKLLKKARVSELEPLWEKPPGAKTLVPTSDKRDTQVPAIETMFAEFLS